MLLKVFLMSFFKLDSGLYALVYELDLCYVIIGVFPFYILFMITLVCSKPYKLCFLLDIEVNDLKWKLSANSL